MLAAARARGFAAAGTAPLAPLPAEAERLRAYLARGAQAGMDYLARDPAGRADPGRRWSWARGLVSVALPLAALEPAAHPAPPGVAAYARGRDYHDVVREKLEALAAVLAGPLGFERWQALVDAAPLLEKAWAAKAGLGWIGRNTLLINEALGSRLVLGELLVDAELPAPAPAADRCGDCRLCLNACPTGALGANGMEDAGKCLSYLTVEYAGEVAPELAAEWGDTLFGCDRCQDACPFNEGRPAGLAPAPGDPAAAWEEILELDEAGFERRFAGTALLRPGLEGLKRSARLALARRR